MGGVGGHGGVKMETTVLEQQLKTLKMTNDLFHSFIHSFTE